MVQCANFWSVVLRGEPVRPSEDGRVPKYAATKPPVDQYYDHDAERKDKQESERARQKNQQITYMKRLIVHPSFINATYAQVIKYMESQDQGEAIFRPSSKGVLCSLLVLAFILCTGTGLDEHFIVYCTIPGAEYLLFYEAIYAYL